MAHRVVPVALRFAPLLALALLAAGCGKSKERELYEQREAACASVLGLTVSQAEVALLHNVDSGDVDCPAGLNRIDETDTCGGSTTGPYTSTVCRVFFLWSASDPGLCNDSTGCVYGCVARVTPGDATTLDDVTICARAWLP